MLRYKKKMQQIPWENNHPSIYKGFSININGFFIHLTKLILHVFTMITCVHRTTLEKINLRFSSFLYTDAGFCKSLQCTFIHQCVSIRLKGNAGIFSQITFNTQSKGTNGKKLAYTVYQTFEVSAFPSALGDTPEPRGRAPAPLESTACWHRALAFPRQHAQLSLNEFLLSSLWADPTQQQFCNTHCSHIYHLNPQITFGNLLENRQPFFPIGISSQELSCNCCLEGSSGGHLV